MASARAFTHCSNKPFYFTKTYELTCDDGDMPTPYAFKVRDDTAAIARIRTGEKSFRAGFEKESHNSAARH
jgi:hypothetical protein